MRQTIGTRKSPGAKTQDFGKGLAAAQSGDFATALKEWRPLAEQGDAQAQIILVLCMIMEMALFRIMLKL
jgi:TPR repeat protein